MVSSGPKLTTDLKRLVLIVVCEFFKHCFVHYSCGAALCHNSDVFLPGFQRRKFSITSHLISQHLVPQKPNTLHTESAMDLLCKQTQMRHSAWEIFVVCCCTAQYSFFAICRMGKELQQDSLYSSPLPLPCCVQSGACQRVFKKPFSGKLHASLPRCSLQE